MQSRGISSGDDGQGKGLTMWIITIGNDPDTTGERTIAGTWTEADGATFAFSERIGPTVFIAHAVAARDAWREKNAADKAASDSLLAALNTADPEVK